MDKFYQKCFISEPTAFKNYNSDCSSQIFAEINDFSVESINDCIKNSFVEPGNYSTDNKLLAEDQ